MIVRVISGFLFFLQSRSAFSFTTIERFVSSRCMMRCRDEKVRCSGPKKYPDPKELNHRLDGSTPLRASADFTAQSTRTSMWVNYNGPIVLVGRSSTRGDNEVQRLATSLTSSMGCTVEMAAPGTNVNVLQGKQWPHVIVVDLSNALNGDAAAEYKALIATLYQRNVLIMYINILTPNESRSTALDDFLLRNSDYELIVKVATGERHDESQQCSWTHLEWELVRLLARARLPSAIPGSSTPSVNTAHLTMGPHTFFLSLSFPDIKQVYPYAESLCQDVDAMEYRVDLLECRDSRTELIYGLQLLRQYCRPHVVRVPALPVAGSDGNTHLLDDVVPVVYTVRTQGQAGTYPDHERGIDNMFSLLEWGLRSGVEVLDVESAWNRVVTDALLDLAQARYSSQILGSHHVVGKEVTSEEAVSLFEQCAFRGRAHGAKLVLSIKTEESDRMAYEASLIAAELARAKGLPRIPYISLVLGDVGAFSRVLNLPFTPVTHESLPFKAAPGQMTANEIMATRLLTKIFNPKKYAIVGHNIAYSVSPQMHGAAFIATKQAHDFVRVDVATVEEFMCSSLFLSSDFGGSSVTIPHKQAVVPYMNVLSEEAREIGSVNTIVVQEEFGEDGFRRVLYGDNTDWKGIFNPLSRLIDTKSHSKNGFALILGAGGTARAAAFVASRKLGLNCIYYNRTPSKAQDLVRSFGGAVVASLERSGDNTLGGHLEEAWEGSHASSAIRVVISTIPANAKFVLPDWIYDRMDSNTLVLLDVNYKPYYTDLLRQAELKGCKLVRGSEMLWEQGIGQFELWTGRTAPYRIMKQVVLENCVDCPT